jgi:hypothetical protein
MTVFRPVSKSTKVSAGQRAIHSSSRGTSVPGCSRSFNKTTKDCSWIFTRTPLLRNSCACGSSWNAAKRYCRESLMDCARYSSRAIKAGAQRLRAADIQCHERLVFPVCCFDQTFDVVRPYS